MPTPAYEAPPRFVRPMLCCSGALPADDAWCFEVKWDGIRAQLRVADRQACLRSRPGRDCGEEFAEILAAAENVQAESLILDGELVCLDDAGRPDFAALRGRLGSRGLGQRPVRYVVFDVLHLDGQSTRSLPYRARRGALEQLDLKPPFLVPRTFGPRELEHLLAWTRREHLEGVVAKRLDSRYRPGRRSESWVKHKNRRDERLVVSGWIPGTDKKRDSYLVMRRRAGRLEPAGTVSMGLGRDERKRLVEALALERHGRRRVRRATRPVEILASVHGPLKAPVRDPVVREVLWSNRAVAVGD